MVEIQPFKFQKSTNIEEHNQMKDKINEMVDVINNVDLDNLPSQINALETEVATQGNEIDALEVAIDSIPDTYAKKTDIPDVSEFITADALTPYAKTVDVDNADVTGVDASISNGEITIKLTRPDGDMSDSIDCPFIQTATLIPTSTARAFKIRFTYTDGTQYDTNEFVIPEGGGTDVSVTGVTVGNGTAPNSFNVAIQLSDASTINSNDYVIEFPENTDTYPTTLTGTLNGTILNLTIGLNDSSSVKGTAELSGLLTNYATKSYVDTQVATRLDKTTADGYYQPKGNYLTKVPIGGTAIGGVKNGGNVTIEADGTMNATGGSGDGWEVLNLSNLPTDFSAGDEIEIVLQTTISYSSTGWNNIPTGITIDVYDGILTPVKIILPEANTDVNLHRNLITAINSPYCIGILSFEKLYKRESWNTSNLFSLCASAFNAGGNDYDNIIINRSNAGNYIHSMKRKKATQ